MTSKTCTNCGKTQDISCFGIKGTKTWCRICSNEYARVYRAKNADIIKEKNKAYHQKNRDKKKEYDKMRLEYVRLRDRLRYANDMNFRIKKVLRTRLYKTIKGLKNSKSILMYLDVSLEAFKAFLEFQFTDDMSWENYATSWEIDHVVPCSFFDLTKEDEKHVCFNWKNMRPLPKVENQEKSATFDLTIVQEHTKVVDKFLDSQSVPS